MSTEMILTCAASTQLMADVIGLSKHFSERHGVYIVTSSALPLLDMLGIPVECKRGQPKRIRYNKRLNRGWYKQEGFVHTDWQGHEYTLVAYPFMTGPEIKRHPAYNPDGCETHGAWCETGLKLKWKRNEMHAFVKKLANHDPFTIRCLHPPKLPVTADCDLPAEIMVHIAEHLDQRERMILWSMGALPMRRIRLLDGKGRIAIIPSDYGWAWYLFDVDNIRAPLLGAVAHKSVMPETLNRRHGPQLHECTLTCDCEFVPFAGDYVFYRVQGQYLRFNESAFWHVPRKDEIRVSNIPIDCWEKSGYDEYDHKDRLKHFLLNYE